VAALQDLTGNLLLAAPGVPEPLAEARYLDAAREFFRRSLAWVEKVPVAADLTLNTPAGAEAFDARRALLDDRRLIKATRVQMQDLAPENRVEYFRIAANKIHLAGDPTEDVSGRLTVYANLRPTREAAEIPDEIADEFGEHLENGAIARLLALPGRAWTDASTATYHWRLFLDAADEWAARGVDEGMTGVRRTVRYGGL